jgi:hypothetical protein
MNTSTNVEAQDRLRMRVLLGFEDLGFFWVDLRVLGFGRGLGL